MDQKGALIVISGFSGAGKGTLMKRLVEKYQTYALSISMTTRKQRVGDVDGKDYFFVSTEHFEDTIKKGGLLEYASYCNNYYGTPKDYVEQCLNAGKDVILEIEIQGAMKIKKQFPETCLIFVTPPSAEILTKRLTDRGTENEEVIKQRLARAVNEADGIEDYDYIVFNDQLEICVEQIHQIVNAIHAKANRSFDTIEKIRKDLENYLEGDKK